ncbi:MerR family transcriptional regulator [Anaerosolibacter sp.]|uniref:MerR family transcriptional regulator n=1 Tax=Anaerosolibacter sp. TaxID=1872527 RepID=UPI0039EE73FA
MKGLTISQVAEGANVNIETVRYYEKLGLISKPPRTEAGYRQFPGEVIQRIKFIKRAQELGFTLSEVGKLLAVSDGGDFDCYDIQQFASKKLEEIEQKMRDLEKIKSILQSLSSKCPGQGSPVNKCPILEEFKEGGV